MARRLTTDAKIVLERAGYRVTGGSKTLFAHHHSIAMYPLIVTGGTVDNDEVVKLLNIRGFDEFGRPDKNAVFGELPR